MRLRTHFLLLTCATLAPFLIFVVLVAIEVNDQTRSAAEEGLRRTAHAISVSIDHNVVDAKHSLEGVANELEIEFGEYDEAYEEAARAVEAHPNIDAIILARPDGEIIYHTSFPFGAELPSLPSGHFDEEKVFTDREASISGRLVESATDGAAVLPVALPVLKDGDTAYVLLGYLSLPRISEVLAEQQLSAGWVAGVMDKEGMILGRSSDPRDFVGEAAREPFLSLAGRGEERLMEYGADEDVAFLAVVSPAVTTGWSVFLAAPSEILIGPAWRAAALSAAGGVALVGVGFVIALLYGRRISAALLALVGPARSLGRGEEPKIDDRNPVSEVRQVASAMRTAYGRLSERERERDEATLQMQSRAAEQGAIAMLSQMALEEADPQKVYEAATSIMASTLNADIVSIALLEPDRRTLHLTAGYGWKKGTLGTSVPLDSCALAVEVMKSEGPVVVKDYRAAGSIVAHPLLREHSVRSSVGVKIRSPEDTFGSVIVHSRRPCGFKRSDVQFLHSVSFILGAGLARTLRQRVLEEQKVRLKAILDHVLDGVITADEEGRIESVNPSAERIFGYDAEELVGKNLKVLMPEAVRKKHDSFLDRYLRTGVSRIINQTTELEGRRKNGEIFPLSIGVGEIHLDGNRVFIGTLQDLSERKKVEEMVRQSQKMEAIGQLTGGIAHDINNLLTVILGNAEQLSETAESDDRQSMLDAIVASSELGAQLIRRLLAFARRQSLTPKTVAVNGLLVGFETVLRRALGETIAVELKLSGDAGAIKVDRAALESSLLNLAINARDALPEGGRVVIESRRVEMHDAAARIAEVQPGSFAMIAITDDGVGMRPDVSGRAFEPFFTTKEQGRGTGLGLSMVFGFVKQSGGHVRLLSQPGQGTTVELYFPSVETVETSISGDVGAVQESLPRGDEHVLVVEDDSSVREFVERQLTQLGYNVDVAGDATEALDKLRGKIGFDLLLSDIVLPGKMDGWKLAAEARRRFPSLRVLHTSGYTKEMVDGQGISRVHVEMLRKPYHLAELARMVRAALDRPSDA